MTVQEHAENEKSCLWHAPDYSNGEFKNELFCVRFASVENCKAFMEMFQEVAESQKQSEETVEADKVAEKMGNLEVKEENSENFSCSAEVAEQLKLLSNLAYSPELQPKGFLESSSSIPLLGLLAGAPSASTYVTKLAKVKMLKDVRPLYDKVVESFLGKIFPDGYPYSVNEGYLRYTQFRVLQHFTSAALSVLSTQSLLFIASLRPTPAQATGVSWILKDGMQHTGKLICSNLGSVMDS